MENTITNISLASNYQLPQNTPAATVTIEKTANGPEIKGVNTPGLAGNEGKVLGSFAVVLEDSPKANQKPIALILNAQHDKDGVLSKDKGHYRRDRHNLETLGYEIREFYVENPNEEISQIIAQFGEGEIGFVWTRVHGHPNEMQYGESQDTGFLKSSDVKTCFAELPEKLTQDAVIFLDSCSTGSLDGDFKQNMQFQFVDLTLDMSDVQVVAPHRLLVNGSFQFNKKTESWSFSMSGRESSWGGRSYANIAVVVGAEEKSKLKAQDAGLKAELEAKMNLNSFNDTITHWPRKLLEDLLNTSCFVIDNEWIADFQRILEDYKVDINWKNKGAFVPSQKSILNALLYKVNIEEKKGSCDFGEAQKLWDLLFEYGINLETLNEAIAYAEKLKSGLVLSLSLHKLRLEDEGSAS